MYMKNVDVSRYVYIEVYEKFLFVFFSVCEFGCLSFCFVNVSLVFMCMRMRMFKLVCSFCECVCLCLRVC